MSAPSPEAQFCTVRGQSEDNLFLERRGSILIQSVEALAEEELGLGSSEGDKFLYVPVIVTAAKIWLCDFDPHSTNIESGELPSSGIKANEVPFIRFRKALRGRGPTSRAQSLEEAYVENERTVLVVQAKALAQLLIDLLIKPMYSQTWPHDILRERLQDFQIAGPGTVFTGL
jgi:hypothetical protein